MQSRYSRGQGSTGQGGSSMPRPAWGSGGGGPAAHAAARAASPEPGGFAAAANERPASGTTPQDEVILQLENELAELRNACQWKDQRIAELSRTDAPTARLKRDVRLLASELHITRKQLSDSVGELQELQQQLARGGGGGEAGGTSAGTASRPGEAGGASAGAIAAGGRDVLDSPAAAGVAGAGKGGDRQLRERIAEVQEENRQLRDTVLQLKTQLASRNADTSAEGLDGAHHARQPSGASTQRANEPPQQPGGNVSRVEGHPGPGFVVAAPRYIAPLPGAVPVGVQTGSMGAAAGAAMAVTAVTPTPCDEPVRQVVYSSAHTENTTTIGTTHMQGVGTVEGVTNVARVLLQRMQSSVFSAQRRAAAL